MIIIGKLRWKEIKPAIRKVKGIDGRFRYTLMIQKTLTMIQLTFK